MSPTTDEKLATDPSTTDPPSAIARTDERNKVSVRMGVAPQSIEEAWRMAQFMAQSEIVPKQYRGKPADVLVAIQFGMELGFAPMQALQSIGVINGRPGVFGDGFLALVMSSSLYRDHDEYYEVDGERRDILTLEDLKKDTTAAVCTFWRVGKPTPTTRRFSIGQAKKAQLLGKEGPWSNYPDRMLLMRARGFAGRDAFPDLLRGIKTAEELRDTPDEDALEMPARQAPVQPRRVSDARPIASSPAAPVAPEVAAEPRTSAQEIRGLSIVHTGFVKPNAGEPYYEITAKTSTGGERKFLTRDELVYKEAASFEGTDHLVVVQFHDAKTADQVPVLVLDALSIYEGQAPAAGDSNGALFR